MREAITTLTTVRNEHAPRAPIRSSYRFSPSFFRDVDLPITEQEMRDEYAQAIRDVMSDLLVPVYRAAPLHCGPHGLPVTHQNVANHVTHEDVAHCVDQLVAARLARKKRQEYADQKAGELPPVMAPCKSPAQCAGEPPRHVHLLLVDSDKAQRLTRALQPGMRRLMADVAARGGTVRVSRFGCHTRIGRPQTTLPPEETDWPFDALDERGGWHACLRDALMVAVREDAESSEPVAVVVVMCGEDEVSATSAIDLLKFAYEAKHLEFAMLQIGPAYDFETDRDPRWDLCTEGDISKIRGLFSTLLVVPPDPQSVRTGFTKCASA
jgi:hypothetical protein